MADTIIWKGLIESDLNGTTVIIPSVAVGNVGQLACDLLISTSKMKKIASIYNPVLIPVLGYDPYDLFSENLTTCCELYKSDAQNIAVLQIRAPLVFKYAREFLEDTVKQFKAKSIKDIIILTSSFAQENKHIQTSPFRYIANELSTYQSKIESLNMTRHSVQDASGVTIYGGGFASLLYSISDEAGVPCLVLYKYCSEGDNIPDAYEMVGCLSSIVSMIPNSKQLVQPVSWKLLFGRPPPSDIY